MITVQEHRKIDAADLPGLDPGRLRERINYDTSRFVTDKVNLIRYEFDPGEGRDGFYSYFRIGAEWLDREQTQPVAVIPKIRGIDFIGMFTTCLQTAESSDGFDSVYSIDFDAPPIRSAALSSVLSPLLVVQYLMVMKRILNRGLRRDYTPRAGNLGKVKGRPDIMRNERQNILTGHCERVFCRYDEFSADTPENRLLKRALRTSRDMVSLMRDHDSYATLSALCNHCLSHFEGVADSNISTALPRVKNSKLYREYADAIRYAVMILRRQDLAVSRHDSAMAEYVPVFRLDMALLFEHYTLALLRRSFGAESVRYQAPGFGGRFYADFLISKGSFRVIADAKYHDPETGNAVKPDYIKQLSAYARDRNLLAALGYDRRGGDDSLPIVPCVILYPDYSGRAEKPGAANLLSRPARGVVKFGSFPVAVPMLQGARQ